MVDLRRPPMDPMRLKELLWPDVTFFKEQIDYIYSIWHNDETGLVAANMTGKDFTTAFLCLALFLTRSPCRGITTSAKEDHLRVLWGEIGNFIQTSRFPLDSRRGGPLQLKHQELRRVRRDGSIDPISYVRGMVAGPDSIASLQGHHVADVGDGVRRTFFFSDESSSVADEYFRMIRTWARIIGLFGNAWPCDNHFRWMFSGFPGTDDRGGDVPRDPSDLSKGYYRRCLRIKAEDSPNVRFAREEIARGLEPSDAVIVPGVISWSEYQKRRRMWDKVQQCVGLDAEWYEGGEVLLYPPDWLNHSEQLAIELELSGKKRKALGMGIDPAEGGDDCVWTVVDGRGVIEQVGYKTPDTDVIPRQTIALGRKHDLDPGQWVFDRGGGGKQHADRLRKQGYHCRSVGFGRVPQPDPDYGHKFPDESIEDRERAYAYLTRRAEMYGQLSIRMNPRSEHGGFAIPRELGELRRQLAPIQKVYDSDGRLWLPPKQRKPGQKMLTMKTLTEILGCSPDEADSLVLAVWAMENPARVVVVG